MHIRPSLLLRSILLSVFATVMLLLLHSCRENSAAANRVVIIQPFEGIPAAIVKTVYERVKKVLPKTLLKTAIPLPANAWYGPRKRYRADTIITYLNHFGNEDTVIIGLTNKDISTRNGGNTDWGVMGLGFSPGNACVSSTFRLNKTKLPEQFFKVALHELGHTQGLPHCPNKTCIMRDAKGGNHLDEEIAFCAKCTTFLSRKGWHLQKSL